MKNQKESQREYCEELKQQLISYVMCNNVSVLMPVIKCKPESLTTIKSKLTPTSTNDEVADVIKAYCTDELSKLSDRYLLDNQQQSAIVILQDILR
jgi:hypothetical protein